MDFDEILDSGREAQCKKKTDGGNNQLEDERIKVMERLRAQLLQRNIKRKRRRRRKNGKKIKDQSAPSQSEIKVKEESGFGGAHRVLNKDDEKLIENQDAQKESTHQIDEEKNTIEVKDRDTYRAEVDVASAVHRGSAANIADDDDDDDDDGFMPRRLFFFSFTQFKSDDRTNY